MAFVLVALLPACSPKKKQSEPAILENTLRNFPDVYPEPLNELRAERGKVIYQNKCTTCHDLDRKIIGPPLRGVTQRRTYNWLMNMILYPDQWVKTDSIARALHKEYNYVQMIIPDGITEDQAMAVVDYLRLESQKGAP
ncbi:MAG: cytochrome c [Chitinophagales bacterium]|nr:cytochrome c [Chitinophagales bacterium]MDW8427376.1 cytochrome c [Chitinophagales bacterium]